MGKIRNLDSAIRYAEAMGAVNRAAQAAQDFPNASASFKADNPHIFPKGTLGQVLLEPENPGPTREEAKIEKELQEQIIGFLERNNTVVIRSRTDKKTSTNVGTPDLIFALKGRAVGFEVKMPGKKPTKEQTEMMARMTANGWRCYVIESYDQAVVTYNKLFLKFVVDPPEA